MSTNSDFFSEEEVDAFTEVELADESENEPMEKNAEAAGVMYVMPISMAGQLNFSSQRFSVPLGYTGWLEILSEDGKTVSPIKTIDKIAECAPDKFLVRSKVKVFLSTDSGEPDYDKTKIVEKGEVMAIVGKLSITHGWRRQKKQVLHCLDSHGKNIYFDFRTSGQFSPIAGRTNISGVHSIEGIINQFRLPLTVRIVSGQIPRVASHNDRPGVFRLIETQKDNTALFLPFLSHQKLMPVSIRTNIQLTQAINMAEIQSHQYYKQLLGLCNKKVEKYFRTMQVLVSAKQQQTETYSAFTLPARRKSSGIRNQTQGTQLMDTEEDVLFAEVDDLYAYVRRGGVPPKPRPRSWANNGDEDHVLMGADGKSSSQPMLTSNKSRGLLATLTAGRYPTKASTLIRQYRVSNTPTTPDQQPNRTLLLDANDIPVTKMSDKIRSFIEKYHGSQESLQTEVDPYIDEGHYKTSTESIDIHRRVTTQTRPLSFAEQRPARPRTLSSSMELLKPASSANSPTERSKGSPITSPTEKKGASPISSPLEKKGFRASLSHLVMPKSKAHLYPHGDRQSPTIAFIESNTKFHQSVQAT